jgi:alpha-D-xyloside xylohydrolase
MGVHKVELKEYSKYDFNLDGIIVELQTGADRLSIKGDFQAIFGLGERFSSVNHKGFKYANHVEEQFCNQKNKTYFPLPFFYTDKKWGVFFETPYQMNFDFTDGITVTFDQSVFPITLYLFGGNPLQMIGDFIELTGKPLCPPKWAFGPWISGHRWNSSKLVDEQLDALIAYKIPVTAMVLEQWSDEATFYVFNQAKYTPKNEPFIYEDFTFESDAPWPDPKGMIDRIHKQGLKLLLWQCPVVKKLGADEPANSQHALDEEEAINKRYIPMMPDETPYRIPNGHWFPGSMIPDFTNAQARRWWFDKRQYLLDIGVDGFKTDGGEFVYSEECIFSNGSTGKSMVNQYAFEYVEAYSAFCGEDRTLFSRAGYIGQQQCPIQWAGDQESTCSELKSVFNAGLSVSSSGQLFWGFDIGGFSGELPTVELYKRAVQFAVFTPIMQLHSEPVGGQFSGMRPTKRFINDRTPWNMATYYEDETLMDEVGYYFNVRMNLLPTIYCEALKAVKSRKPMMQQGLVRFPDDENFIIVNDQYFFGDILVAPILEPGKGQRSVYFPNGLWFNLFSNEAIDGGQSHDLDVSENEVLAFVPSGSALVLNLSVASRLGDFVGNGTIYDHPLTIRCFGKKGCYHYMDSDGNDFVVKWENGQVDIEGTQITEFSYELI